VYDRADVFDGFRFSRIRDDKAKTPEDGIFNRHMVSTGSDHLVFGHGKHSCPGRFFAATGAPVPLLSFLRLTTRVKQN
jgi:cytochrome P450